jgi:beta-barrel assembly-enhancing protease
MTIQTLFKNCVCILYLVTLTSCAGPQKPCLESPECMQARGIWQRAINSVVSANFPSEFGKYRAIIWNDEFDNAWVTKGRNINITKGLLFTISQEELICVAAHELSHLKMGHYYARIGIIIVDKNGYSGELTNEESSGSHYGRGASSYIPEGFGKNQEKEADRLALEFIKKIGIHPMVYLQLLKRFQGETPYPNAPISERIENVLKIIFKQF